MRLLTVAAIGTLGLAAQKSSAGELETIGPPAADAGGDFSLYFENDAFGGNDRDYSNGLRFAGLSKDFGINDAGRLQGAFRPVSNGGDFFKRILGFRELDQVRYNYGLSLTQLIFTPDDRDAFLQADDERRYAGWLGLGFSLQAKDKHTLNVLEFTLGTTGENSLAEHAQDLVHDLLGGSKFNGWENQVPNEVTFDVTFVQKRRFRLFETGAFGLDGIPEWGARLGTFRTDAHLGGFLRAGYHLPDDLSDSRISTTAYSNGGAPRGDWSIYALAGFNGYAVGHDATLDGPLFRDFDTGNDRIPFFGEIYGGVGLRYRRVELSYVHTWRSDEYEEQAQPSIYGSVMLRVLF